VVGFDSVSDAPEVVISDTHGAHCKYGSLIPDQFSIINLDITHMWMYVYCDAGTHT